MGCERLRRIFRPSNPGCRWPEDFAGSNVAVERADPASLFNLYRRLIALRRARPALTRGAYRPIAAAGDVLAYLREAAGDRVLVALNFGRGPAAVALPGGSGTILLSSAGERDGEILGGSFTCGPMRGR